jgi:membrane-bound lytic murein transglycosylase B
MSHKTKLFLRYSATFLIAACVIFVLSKSIKADTASNTAVQRTQLQQQLQDIQNQIAQLQQQMNVIVGQKNTLQNKLKQLQNQQQSLNLQIQATNLRISDLNGKISQAQLAIDSDNLHLQQLQSQISGVIQLMNEDDSKPILYMILADGKFSDIYDDLQSMSSVGNSLALIADQTKNANDQLNNDITSYQQQIDQSNNYLDIQSLQQQQLVASQGEQSTLLKQTKGKESDYQIAISGTQSQAAKIEAQLYALAGGGNTNVTFGQAAQIATNVSSQTGVPAAFLLAILTQESNLGQNVGTCNRAGDPPSKSWKVVMKPDRDQQPFVQITSSLGLDSDVTPVSCPMHDKNGKQIGWGGAMGPAQFIPSTWVGYISQVEAITGKSANPWDINDAFIAAALKLRAGGADGSRQGDWNAAMRYFSGSLNPAYSFYGDNVLTLTDKYQSELQQIGQ